MIKTITNDDLIRYVYDETSEVENEQIESVITWDKEMKNDLSDFQFLKKEISRIEMSPSQKLVDNLLFFSKNYSS